jgi:hypothetical protein
MRFTVIPIMITDTTNKDDIRNEDRVSNDILSRKASGGSSRAPDEQDEKKVKDLNREIMMIFQMYKASYGHTSAALLSVLSYLSNNYLLQHPENKQLLLDYFEKEFDKFLDMIRNHKS